MDEMHRHLETCARCSRHDTAVRRSLMLVRSLPRIEPSADFMARLNSRLRELQGVRDARVPIRAAYGFSSGTFAAVAAVLALIAYLALEASRFGRPAELTLPPVVATAPESPPSLLADPVFVASLSAGMPVWPAVLMADQAQQHLANAEFQEAALR